MKNINELKLHSLRIKKNFIKMYFRAKAGHIGSSLSCVDILTYIYCNLHKGNDEVILSKGHAAAALYATLAEFGYLDLKDLNTFYQNGTLLGAHPPPNKLPYIPFATGSLGHGLSLSAGLGLGFRLKGSHNKVYCITSDGELNEGSTWEAALFINQQRLNNVIWFIDRNRLQGFGNTEDVLSLDSLTDKISSFGFQVYEIDGHSFEDFLDLTLDCPKINKPIAVICNTIKGNGWKRYENTVASHYLPINQEDFNEFSLKIDKELKSLKITENEK
ncbi:MAG: transketolase [Bacteroidia bacterium]|nr:transketolase [Bacteroidia bacterium]